MNNDINIAKTSQPEIADNSANFESWAQGTSIVFLGIGGIGMSAIARYFNIRNVRVSGYDKTPTALTRQLEVEGIHVHYEDSLSFIDKNAALVVYTPALPSDHAELNFYRSNNFKLLKRSEILGMITQHNFNICVAGTHGKTTTSAMIAHILRDSGYGCNAFLGGIATNYNSNFWPAPLHTEASKKNVCVAEADEYDRSFLQLSPDIAVITAMDADHLDIYGTEENMQDAFVEFTGKIRTGGTLISKKGLSRTDDFTATHKMTYSVNDHHADIYAKNIAIRNGSYFFDMFIKDRLVKDVQLNMGGMHNIENVIAAIAVALHLDIDEEKIKNAVASFSGVKRRFEYILRSDAPSLQGKAGVGPVFIDDYAHHPEELRALISSAIELFPGKKCTVIFQPHLFSRTKDLAEGFAEVLSMADEIILLPIYPARELPMAGVSSQLILDGITSKNKSIKEKGELLEWIKEQDIELLISSGAGDIDTLVQPIKEVLTNKF